MGDVDQEFLSGLYRRNSRRDQPIQRGRQAAGPGKVDGYSAHRSDLNSVRRRCEIFDERWPREG